MSEKRYTVMVVDDEAPNRLLMEAALNKQYRVKTVSSGIECLDSIQIELVDLILLDVRMPNMDGYEVCKKIRSQNSTKHIPVIFLSAYAMLSDKLKGYEVGGDDYITKPCELEEVLAKVKRNISIDTSNKDSLCNARDDDAKCGRLNAHMNKIIELHASDTKIEREFDSVAKDIYNLIALSN